MKKLSYIKAWKLLENSTPLSSDCGALCGRACCNGSADEGMLLFPGEENMYDGLADWYSIRDSGILLKNGAPVKLFVCRGFCPREMRPLSCRIFPVAPHIDDLDYLEFVPDLRGANICPLLYESGGEQISPAFIDSLYSSFSTIIGDEMVLNFLEILSEQYDEDVKNLKRFYKDWNI